MRFHVEIRRGFRTARAFNLHEQELHARILAPWSRGAAVALGEREWEPRESQLTILRGPELQPAELAIGQGWQSAERSAQDVTERLLAAPPPLPPGVAVLAQSAAAAQAAAAALARIGVTALGWPPEQGGPAAALIAFDSSVPDGDARWWLEVGRALGALGGHVLLAVLGADAAPPPLDGAAAIRLDAADPQALAERLRLAVRGA